jgi:Amt family ammonium transporter
VFSTSEGLLYGYGASFLLVEVTGVVSVAAWVAVTMTIVFLVIKATIGLRCSAKEELAGLDSSEHGLAASYADFMPSVHVEDARNDLAAPEIAVPVELRPLKGLSSDVKITKIEIITNENKFEGLKAAMSEIGITGMTVTKVMGCGVQKGRAEYYRGAEVEINLLPKISVEIVVSKVPVQLVVDTAKKALYTGHIGDGKIFIYDVQNVVKVRTGEEGFDALQGEDD